MADIQDSPRAKALIKLRTKTSASSSCAAFSDPAECHISGAACQGYFIITGKGCSQEGFGPLAGPYFVHRHLPLVWDISVASRTSSSSGIKSALSGSLTFHCWMTFPPLQLPIQAVFLTKAFVMREVDLG